MRQIISWRPVYSERDLYPSHNPPDGFRIQGTIMVREPAGHAIVDQLAMSMHRRTSASIALLNNHNVLQKRKWPRLAPGPNGCPTISGCPGAGGLLRAARLITLCFKMCSEGVLHFRGQKLSTACQLQCIHAGGRALSVLQFGTLDATGIAAGGQQRNECESRGTVRV
jgi:hypothetical protein